VVTMKRTGRMAPTEGIIFSTNVGIGAPPKCDSCGTDLVAASTTEWKCVNGGCPENGKKKHTDETRFDEVGT